MFEKFSAKINFIFRIPIIGFILISLLLGCSEKIAVTGLVPLSVSTTPPIKVIAGGDPISIQAQTSETGAALTYMWATLEEDCGEFQIVKDTEPVAKYHPPAKQQTCTIKVEGLQGETSAGTAYLEVNIVSTDPTATTMEPPIDANTPCQQSARPPLGGSSVDVAVTFSAIEHCMTLPTTTPIWGEYSGDLTNKEIWILIYPSDAKYYPQSPDACQQLPALATNGTWETTIHLGGPPQQYDLVAVVTETSGAVSGTFKRWLSEGCTTGHYPGFGGLELSSGVTEVSFVTIKKG